MGLWVGGLGDCFPQARHNCHSTPPAPDLFLELRDVPLVPVYIIVITTNTTTRTSIGNIGSILITTRARKWVSGWGGGR